MKLNLGSGNDYIEGFINIDSSTKVKSDLVLDVTQGLPYQNESVEYILAKDFFEHIFLPIPMFNECHRVMKPGGILEIEVPLAGTTEFYKDPTHVRPFVEETFEYFTNETICNHYDIKRWHLQYLREAGNRIFAKLKK